MTKKEYEARRKQLINEAKTATRDRKFEEAKAKTQEVKDLDNDYQEQIEMEASIAALENEQVGIGSMEDYGTEEFQGRRSTEKMNDTKDEKEMTAEEKRQAAIDSKEYATAWTRAMMKDMGGTMSAVEKEKFMLVNGVMEIKSGMVVVIPTYVTEKIWMSMEDSHPIIRDIEKLHIPGNIEMLMEGDSSDAGWYEEDQETEDGDDEVGTLQLTGCELARLVKISWKLQKMAIDDFMNYIAKQMARRMGAALAAGIIRGKGIVGEGQNAKKVEPQGILTGLPETQKVVGELTYDNVIKSKALVSEEYADRVKAYANNWTMQVGLLGIKDANGRPIFANADPVTGGPARLLGAVIELEAGLRNGEIIWGSLDDGYTANESEAMTVMSQEVIKKRHTEFSSYMIIDGGVKGTEAISALCPDPDTKTYEYKELKKMTIAEIKDAAKAKNYTITKTKKSEVIDEFLEAQKAANQG